MAEAYQAEEGEPGNLSNGVLRQHVHYTHVTTNNPQHKQPAEFTRKTFWEHLAKVFKDVYPDEDSSTGSILAFGCVAKEWAEAEHHHSPTFSLKQYYWNKVAKRSLEFYGVPLSAKAHKGYLTMYSYIRSPTTKKPLAALDAQVWHSPNHPQGQALVQYLSHCKKSADLNNQKASGAGDGKRKRLSVFEEIQSSKLRTVVDLHAHAHKESLQGRFALAEFNTRHGRKLAEILKSAGSVIEAPQALIQQNMTLLDKLARAADQLPCSCAGRWIPGAVRVLTWNSISVETFRQSVLTALRLGAVRGANVAVVGCGGCGKSTLLEALENIFACGGKPEKGSTFPLGSIRDCDVILWQDYEHNESTVRFSDLLSWFNGESVQVRIPGELNAQIRNKAPCFYSGRAPLKLQPSLIHPVEVAEEYTGMMAERFETFHFANPLPKAERVRAWRHCRLCCAQLFLHGPPPALQMPPASVALPVVATARVSSTPAVSVSDELARLGALHAAAVIDAAEFSAAKARVGCIDGLFLRADHLGHRARH